MNKVLLRGLGVPLMMWGLSACSAPIPGSSGITLTISNPTQGQDGVPLSFTSTVTMDGDFELGTTACDPRSFEVDLDHFAIQPLYDPYACSDEAGVPPEGHGNVQFFVDGIFHAYSESADVAVNLGASDIKFSLYDYFYDENDDPVDTDDPPDGVPDLYHLCYFYYPNDNLNYASEFYRQALSYTAEDYGYTPLYDLATGAPMAEQPPIYDNIFDTYFAVPFLKFDYNGTEFDAFMPSGGDPEVFQKVNHIFFAELHYDNHGYVYGVNRDRIITAGLDLSSMPGDWCGFNALDLAF